jgi:hypothetical protein
MAIARTAINYDDLVKDDRVHGRVYTDRGVKYQIIPDQIMRKMGEFAGRISPDGGKSWSIATWGLDL